MYRKKLLKLISNCENETFCEFVFVFAEKLKRNWGCYSPVSLINFFYNSIYIAIDFMFMAIRHFRKFCCIL